MPCFDLASLVMTFSYGCGSCEGGKGLPWGGRATAGLRAGGVTVVIAGSCEKGRLAMAMINRAKIVRLLMGSPLTMREVENMLAGIPGEGMICLAGGEFRMGQEDGRDDERPV